VDEAGAFALTTDARGDGPPAGEYVITLEWVPPRASPMEPEGADLLKGAYRDPKASKLRFTVEAAPRNVVPAILVP
jgi:hypothetical protein